MKTTTKRMIGSKTLLLVLTAAVLFITPAAPAAEKVSSDRLLPPNVYLYVSLPNVEDLKERWKKSSWGRLLADEQMADFMEQFDEKFDDFSEKFEQELGVKLSDVLAVPGGESAFAIVQTADKKLAGVKILDFGDNEETVNSILDLAAEKLEEQGAERSIVEFEDTRIVKYTFAGANKRNNRPNTGAYFIKDSYIVLSNSTATLEDILVRWDGKHEETFADDEIYKHITERCTGKGSEPVFSWYVNPIGLFKAAIASQGRNNFQMAIVFRLMDSLGLNDLKAIGGRLELAGEEFASVHRMLVYVDLPTKGLLRLFRFPAAELEPPKWVSAASSQCIVMNWDVEAAYEGMQEVFDSFPGNGPGAFVRMVDKLAESDGGPKLHLKKDFFDHLNGLVVIASEPPKDGAPPQANGLFAFGTKDAGKMKATMVKIAESLGGRVKTREFQGVTLYEFPLNAGVVAAGLRIGAAVANDHLLIAANVTAIEQVLRDDSERESFVDSKAYRDIAAHFPEKTSMLGVEMTDTQFKSIYEDLQRKRGLAIQVRQIDFTKLPPFEEIRKYFTPQGTYAIPDKHGALLVTFSLPDQAD